MHRGKNWRRAGGIDHYAHKLGLCFWLHIAAFYYQALWNFLAQQQTTRPGHCLEKFRYCLQQR